jgi:hypothetical protein
MADMRKAAWALVRPASTATGGRWWNGINRPEIYCYQTFKSFNYELVYIAILNHPHFDRGQCCV